MMARRFTGKHMTLVLVGFFGVIMAVNFTMAKLAVGGFGGTVVDNSYVASQNFEKWRDEARAQEQLGWDLAAGIDGEGHVVLTVTGVTGAEVEAVAEHRLRKALDHPLELVATDDGWRSAAPLEAGRWQLRAIVTANEREARFLLPLDV